MDSLKIYEKLPCMNCLIKVVCCNQLLNGSIQYPKNPCESFEKWIIKYHSIVESMSYTEEVQFNLEVLEYWKKNLF